MIPGRGAGRAPGRCAGLADRVGGREAAVEVPRGGSGRAGESGRGRDGRARSTTPAPEHHEEEAAGPLSNWRERSNWREALKGLDERFPKLSHWLGGRLDIEVPGDRRERRRAPGDHLRPGHGRLRRPPRGRAPVRGRRRGRHVDGELRPRPRHTDQDIDHDRREARRGGGRLVRAQLLGGVTLDRRARRPGRVSTPSDLKASAPAAWPRSTSRSPPTWSPPRRRCSARRCRSRGAGPSTSAAPRGPSTGSPTKSSSRLEKNRTLVVWAFDASGSLQAERERLAKHIETVYKHINQLDAKGLSGNGGLLTAVVAFGHDRKAMTATPTDDNATIASAIRDVAARLDRDRDHVHHRRRGRPQVGPTTRTPRGTSTRRW